MKRAAAWLVVGLVGCQLPPGRVAGGPTDLLSADAAASPDLAQPDLSQPMPNPDLLMVDLSPPALDGNMLGVVASNTLATLWFNVTDGDTGLPTPSRVIFRPPPGAGFADSITRGQFQINSPGSATGAVVGPGVVGSPEGVLLATGVGSVPVPPGTYELFITRGPEYEASDATIVIKSGEIRRVDVELSRTVDTRGWLASDMHVHTAASFDSALPQDRRVISMVTNGIELMVSTEHNASFDFAPVIAALGYSGDMIGSLVGDEFNFQPGHAGAYPVNYDATKPAGGVPTWDDPCVPGVSVQCTSASQMFDIMHRQIPGVTVVTINHPWWGGADLGYFTNINWGAGTNNPPPAPLITAGQFDALEVLNGYWTRSDAISYLVTDWMFLLSQGYRVTALGNSDTHKINWVRAGWPRTWLRMPTDRPGDVTPQMLSDAIRLQRAVASTGPFAELTVNGQPIGETVSTQAGSVTVEMSVDAPSWMQVDVVRLYQSGQLLHEYAVVPGHRPVFHNVLTVPVTGDSWFVLQAEGAQPLPPDVVGEVSQQNGYNMQPFVITNPVFIDGDGDGQWHPPAWTGAPQPFGKPQRAPNQDRFHRGPLGDGPMGHNGPVPEGCSPGETEPPLSAAGAAARYLAPLVNP